MQLNLVIVATDQTPGADVFSQPPRAGDAICPGDLALISGERGRDNDKRQIAVQRLEVLEVPDRCREVAP